MANPTSLIEFAEHKRDTLQSALEEASDDLAKAQQASKTAIETYKQATINIADADKKIAKIKQKLAEIDTSVEGEPLLQALTDAIIDQRLKVSALTTADLERGKASAELALAQSVFQEVKQDFDAAKSHLSKAELDKKRRDEAIAAITQPPISEIAQKATDALSSEEYFGAKRWIEDALPEMLRNRAKERFNQAAGSLERAYSIQKQAQVSYDTAVEGAAINDTKLNHLERTVKSAESTLFNCVGRSPQDLLAATSILKRLNEVGDPAAKVADTSAALKIERDKVLALDPNADLATLEADETTDLGKAKKAWEQAKAELASAAQKTDQLTDEERAYIYDVDYIADKSLSDKVDNTFTALEIERNKVLALDPNADLATLEADETTDLGKAKKAWEQAKAELAATDRKLAVEAEATRDAAAVKETDTFVLLEIERVKVLAQDPNADLATLESDDTTNLGKAKKAWEQAKADLAVEEGKFTPAQRQVLNEWQASVPEFIWKDAESFYRAEAELNRLKSDPTGLVTALQNAEQALLQALIQHEQERQQIHYLSIELAKREAASEELQQRISQRQADALRGTLKL
jgi:uncharacterized protein (UPF0548 family)